MNIFTKKTLEFSLERISKYEKFYKGINIEKIESLNDARKIMYYQDLLHKKGLDDDYFFFIYSIVIQERLKNLNIGYDFLYGMSDNLRKDSDFEELLIKYAGDISIEDYVSKRKLTYKEFAAEFKVCPGDHECRKFNRNCWKCRLSHFDPDELYEPMSVHFKNGGAAADKLIFQDSDVKDEDYSKKMNQKKD